MQGGTIYTVYSLFLLSLLSPSSPLSFNPSPSLQTSQPSVKEILFHSPLKEESYVGRLNTMAAVFLFLQVRAELDEEFCDLAFELGQMLVVQYFDKELQVMFLAHSTRTHTHNEEHMCKGCFLYND